MDSYIRILKKKSPKILILQATYLVFIAFFKWTIHPSLETLIFILGGLFGIYLLDIADHFVNIDPSPFRSIVFFGALGLVMLFIVTSSGSYVATGLVLSIYLSILVEFGNAIVRNTNQDGWFSQLADPVGKTTQRILLGVSIVVFVLASLLFIT